MVVRYSIGIIEAGGIVAQLSAWDEDEVNTNQ